VAAKKKTVNFLTIFLIFNVRNSMIIPNYIDTVKDGRLTSALLKLFTFLAAAIAVFKNGHFTLTSLNQSANIFLVSK